MPFSFIEIEQKKGRIIDFLFAFVLVFYFLTAYLVLLVLKITLLPWFGDVGRSFFSLPTISQTLGAFAASFAIALIHWWFSTNNLIERLTTVIDASPIDEKDEYHLYFKKIVEEVSVAIGGRRLEAWIISSSSMNAFALEDFKGRAIIGITEGLLIRLNRNQIEAVVGHEAGHIVSGDCLSTTISCSLGEVYEGALTRLGAGFRNSRGRGLFTFGILYLLLAFMRMISNMVRFFISREREYRADAISVRLTRNPLSLAEALKLISGNWRGAGSIGDKLQSIFIVNPIANTLDESEGFFADLFSTHPPMKKRIAILLDMAHLDERTLESNLKNFKRVAPIASAEFIDEHRSPRWFVLINGVWSGPLGVEEIKKLEGFKPDQWVKREDQRKVRYAYDERELLDLFSHSPQAEQILSCPNCKTALDEVTYEGAPIFKCSFCGGGLLEAKKVNRILIREDKDFSAEVVRLSEVILQSKEKLHYFPRQDPKSLWVVDCPKCRQKMHRQFFVYSYPVEIELCSYCQLYWFNKDELEILQYLYQHRRNIFGEL